MLTRRMFHQYDSIWPSGWRLIQCRRIITYRRILVRRADIVAYRRANANETFIVWLIIPSPSVAFAA